MVLPSTKPQEFLRRRDASPSKGLRRVVRVTQGEPVFDARGSRRFRLTAVSFFVVEDSRSFTHRCFSRPSLRDHFAASKRPDASKHRNSMIRVFFWLTAELSAVSTTAVSLMLRQVVFSHPGYSDPLTNNLYKFTSGARFSIGSTRFLMPRTRSSLLKKRKKSVLNRKIMERHWPISLEVFFKKIFKTLRCWQQR